MSFAIGTAVRELELVRHPQDAGAIHPPRRADEMIGRRSGSVPRSKIGVAEGHVAPDHVEGGVAENPMEAEHVTVVDEIAPGEREPAALGKVLRREWVDHGHWDDPSAHILSIVTESHFRELSPEPASSQDAPQRINRLDLGSLRPA